MNLPVYLVSSICHGPLPQPVCCDAQLSRFVVSQRHGVHVERSLDQFRIGVDHLPHPFDLPLVSVYSCYVTQSFGLTMSRPQVTIPHGPALLSPSLSLHQPTPTVSPIQAFSSVSPSSGHPPVNRQISPQRVTFLPTRMKESTIPP